MQTESKKKTSSGKNSAIEKALDILLEFVPNNQEMGTLEVSTRLGLHKATASRVLLTLTKRGYLQQDADSKRFRLGRSALTLGRAVLDSLNNGVIPVAGPHMEDLRNALETSVVLEQLVGNRTVIMHVAHGPQRIRLAGNVGDAVPVNAAAGAKVILAFSDPKLTEKILEERPKFTAMTPNTIITSHALKRHLREIRRKGFSVDNEEIDIGVKAIGVPIFNHEGSPVAALAVVFSSHRLGEEVDPDVVSKIKKAADDISTDLVSGSVGM